MMSSLLMGSTTLWYGFPYTYQMIMERIPPEMRISRPDERTVLVMNATMMRTEAVIEAWPLETLVICDHYELECRAKVLLDRVAANAGVQFSLTYWRLDDLPDPSADVGAFSNVWCPMLLMLALRTWGELPKSAFEWAEEWARCRAGGYSALVMLGNAKAAAVKELQQIAGRRGITLFCEPATESALGCPSLIAGLKGRAQILTPILAKTLGESESGYSHWGINE